MPWRWLHEVFLTTYTSPSYKHENEETRNHTTVLQHLISNFFQRIRLRPRSASRLHCPRGWNETARAIRGGRSRRFIQPLLGLGLRLCPRVTFAPPPCSLPYTPFYLVLLLRDFMYVHPSTSPYQYYDNCNKRNTLYITHWNSYLLYI